MEALLRDARIEQQKRRSLEMLQAGVDRWTRLSMPVEHRVTAKVETKSTVHTQERCGGGKIGGMGCGMWKEKGQDCPYCAMAPNRKQVEEAAARERPSTAGSRRRSSSDLQDQVKMQKRRSLDLLEAGVDTFTRLSMPVEHRVTAKVVTNTVAHTQERCGGGKIGGVGCGMWKQKGQECPFCKNAPNRKQVQDLVDDPKAAEKAIELQKRRSLEMQQAGVDLFTRLSMPPEHLKTTKVETKSTVHTQERCGGGKIGGMGCGMWKPKGQDCPYCATMVNRKQVQDLIDDPKAAEKAIELQKRRSLELQQAGVDTFTRLSMPAEHRVTAKVETKSVAHTQERCGGGKIGGVGCGMWKEKGQECPFCTNAVNRKQVQDIVDGPKAAARFIEQQRRRSLELLQGGVDTFTRLSMPAEHRVTAKVETKSVAHTQERCGGGTIGGMGCGMWKEKGQPCQFCLNAPNRKQVEEALMSRRSSSAGAWRRSAVDSLRASVQESRDVTCENL